MSRQIKLPTRELGEIRLELIRTEGEGWEQEWEPLRGTAFGDQFSVISKGALDHGLRKWTKPLADELGIPPAGALKKIPFAQRKCFRRERCPHFDSSQCFPEAKNMPWCFEPDGVARDDVRNAASRAISIWRDRVYLVVVKG